MSSPSISILGCGWLGFPLGSALVKEGFVVRGSTTTPANCSVLEKSGIIPFLLKCNPQLEGDAIDEFLRSEILIIAIPFRRDFENPWEYKSQIESIIDKAERSSVRYIIFTGSTAVYPGRMAMAIEDKSFEPDNLRSEVLLNIEQTILQNSLFKATIIRLGGLCGGGRLVGRFLSGKKDLSGADDPVNLIHQDDCIQIILEIIRQGAWGEIFNACADQHPTRQELYTAAARCLNLPPPTFIAGNAAGSLKVVSNEKIRRQLNYRFQHPDPLEF